MPYLEHGLLVLAVFHLGLGEVEYGPLNPVLVRVVDVDIWAPDHHKALHPPVSVGLQKVQVAFFGDNGAAEGTEVRVGDGPQGSGNSMAWTPLVPRGPSRGAPAAPT